jgi:hypothetical protein
MKNLFLLYKEHETALNIFLTFASICLAVVGIYLAIYGINLSKQYKNDELTTGKNAMDQKISQIAWLKMAYAPNKLDWTSLSQSDVEFLLHNTFNLLDSETNNQYIFMQKNCGTDWNHFASLYWIWENVPEDFSLQGNIHINGKINLPKEYGDDIMSLLNDCR